MSAVTVIGRNAFNNCTGLTDASLGGKTANALSMGLRAFQDCTNLKTVQFANVENIGQYVDHFFDTTKIAIQIRQGLDPQEQRRAKDTYKLLHWDESAVLSRRAEAAMAQKYTEITGTSITQAMLENTLTYKPGIL